MDAITHLLVGRLLAAPLGGPLGWLATLFAVLPDFDTLAWAFPRLRRWVSHRGITHTLPFGLAASAVAGLVFALAGWSSFLPAFAVAFAAFLTHVGLDVLNWGAPVLWPWRAGRLEWTVHGGFGWSAGLSALGLLLLGGVQLAWPERLGLLAALLAALFVAYLALRASVKLVAGRRHRGARLLPTGNPFVWRVLDAPDADPA